MVVLDTIELPFKLPDFDAVCVHLLTRIGLVLVELVDNQHGVSVHHEAFDAKHDDYTKTMETCFIFYGIVGGWKVYPEDIAEIFFGRRNEQNARTNAVDITGAIKVHQPVLGASGGNGFLDLSPLSDEISERL